MTIQSQRDLDGLLRVGKVVSLALGEMKRRVKAGTTTQELDSVCLDAFELNNVLRTYDTRVMGELLRGLAWR